ncbi:ABC transporter permease [Desemzia sp. RIT804]|uniref:ABC transporter permease n=1 Tax=Desemzia sp. RIT 804 TaxID=2810209 RepID=UPI0019509769|nr:ABC transporter permease [Desemzia sp. RIT 804]MBM6614530.1 ABC transporter permease [Desemzia sp. RIT 804]
MNFSENFKMAIDSVMANKMRSFLTMLGIIIGIAAVIAILGVGNGATDEITGTFNNLGASTISLSVTDEATESEPITENDIAALKEAIPEIERVSPDKTAMTSIQSDFENRQSIISYGTPDLQYTNQIMESTIVSGRYFNQNDYADGKSVIVISEDTAAALFNDRTEVLGEQIKLVGNSGNQLDLTVIGIVEGTFQDLQGSFDLSQMPLYAAIPLTTMEKLNPTLGGIDSLTIQVTDKDAIESVSTQIVRILETRHDAVGENWYSATNFLQALDQVDQVLSLFINFIAAVAGIALLVGGIGVMNIMLVSVTERTREIGTRKALGATTRTILVQFLMESVILCLIGGIIGLILGILLATGVSNALNIVPNITIGSVLLVLLFSSAVGIFFGLYPARKAAKLDPIEALRYE